MMKHSGLAKRDQIVRSSCKMRAEMEAMVIATDIQTEGRCTQEYAWTGGDCFDRKVLLDLACSADIIMQFIVQWQK